MMKEKLGCTCGRKIKDHTDLVVSRRFSTEYNTFTRFSQVKCTRCGGTWQTDSKYIHELPDEVKKNESNQ